MSVEFRRTHDNPLSAFTVVEVAGPHVEGETKVLHADRHRSASKGGCIKTCFSRCYHRNAIHPYVKSNPSLTRVSDALGSFERIPDTLGMLIVSLLDRKTLCSLAMTSRHCRKLSDQATLWQQLCLLDNPDRTPPSDGNWKAEYSAHRNLPVDIGESQKKYEKDTRVRRCVSRCLEVGCYLGIPPISITSAVISFRDNDAIGVRVASIILSVLSVPSLVIRIAHPSGRSIEDDYTYEQQLSADYNAMIGGCMDDRTHFLRVLTIGLLLIPSSLAIGFGFSNLQVSPTPSRLLLTSGFMGLFQVIAPTDETKERLIELLTDPKTYPLYIKGSAKKVQRCFQRVRRRSVCVAIATCFSSCLGRIKRLF